MHSFPNRFAAFMIGLKQSNPDVTAEPITSLLIKTTVKMFSSAAYEASVHKDQ